MYIVCISWYAGMRGKLRTNIIYTLCIIYCSRVNVNLYFHFMIAVLNIHSSTHINIGGLQFVSNQKPITVCTVFSVISVYRWTFHFYKRKNNSVVEAPLHCVIIYSGLRIYAFFSSRILSIHQRCVIYNLILWMYSHFKRLKYSSRLLFPKLIR